MHQNIFLEKKNIKRVMGKRRQKKNVFFTYFNRKSKLETIKCEAQNISEIAQNISTGNTSEQKLTFFLYLKAPNSKK